LENLDEMDKFLDANIQPKLNHNIKNLNSPIICNEIETVIMSIPTKKSSEPYGFTAEFYQSFKEELTTILPKLFQEIERGRTYQTHFMKPASHSFQNPIMT
jgi:hypothetical protein